MLGQLGGASPWDDWYREYETRWSAKQESKLRRLLEKSPDREDYFRELIDRLIKPSLEPSPVAVERLETGSERDIEWLVGALGDDRRKWYVANLAQHANDLPDALCEPMLRASVDEPDPSYNQRFVEPCVRVFSARRVNEYLLGVLESGEDVHQAGPVRAFYWVGTPSDLRQRRRNLFLELFVSKPNLEAHRVLFELCLDASAYPDSHKPLVARAIQIAREHPDYQIRESVEIKLRERPLSASDTDA